MTAFNAPHRLLLGPSVVLAAALGAHVPAWSTAVLDYQVVTRTNVDVTFNNSAQACYNFGSCFGGASGVGPDIQTRQPTGVATAQSGGAADGSSMAQGAGVRASGQDGGTPGTNGAYWAQANASANLAEGMLHASTSNNGKSGLYTEYAGGTAMAEMKDQLTFTRAASTTASHIGVTFSIDGSIASTGTGYRADVLSYLHLGGNSARAVWQGNATNGVTALFDTYPSSVWGAWTWSQPTASSWEAVFVGDILMDQTTLVLPIDVLLDLNCSNGATCDFSHTAKVGLILPSDVQMTSASGVFLSATDPGPGNGVPEPGSMALMLIALGALGSVARKHQL